MKWGTNLWVGGGLVGLAIVTGVFADWLQLTDPVTDANLLNAEIPPSALTGFRNGRPFSGICKFSVGFPRARTRVGSVTHDRAPVAQIATPIDALDLDLLSDAAVVDADTLLRLSDQAMYEAKVGGPGRTTLRRAG